MVTFDVERIHAIYSFKNSEHNFFVYQTDVCLFHEGFQGIDDLQADILGHQFQSYRITFFAQRVN